jgi:mannose-6-phosphate isomerase-like protein (cupin superfamily)
MQRLQPGGPPRIIAALRVPRGLVACRVEADGEGRLRHQSGAKAAKEQSMRNTAIWAAFIVACGSFALAQGGAQAPAEGGGRGPGAEGRTVILEQAPKDHSIAIPKEQLAQHLKDMDAKKLQTLRMIEGGKYNVNIRRITAAETGLVHPITADLWVVLEGGGTLTTGGVLEKGKINGGQSRQIKAGDVVYIPSGLPHGVSGVNNTITWLNVRWDTDWPPDSPMGAGTLNGLMGRAAGARGGPREGAVDARAARAGAAGGAGAPPPTARGPALPPGSQQALPYSYGGSGELFFSKEQLDQIMAGMRLKKSVNTRLIEGGRYNVNLRWNGTPTVELHEQTIDTWYVLAGGATVNTGYQVKDGERVPNTGVSAATKPGDVFFHPSNFYHGFSQVSPDIFWLNIRWDDNYKQN